MYEAFQQRNGLINKPLITNEFPKSARVALQFIIEDLVDKKYIQISYTKNSTYDFINTEIRRLCREQKVDDNNQAISPLFMTMSWHIVYEFIERIYNRLLIEVFFYHDEQDYNELVKTLGAVRDYFTEEINTLLSEENIGYEFTSGLFIRKGYLKTAQSISNAKAVLADPVLSESRKHYNKAAEYFKDSKKPDYENSIKESICSIESCLEVLFSKDITKNFEDGIRKLKGNEELQAPAPIIDSIIKIYGYRNNANGVAHGITTGLKVSEKEAEFILSVAADYITYFYSLLKENIEDIPF